VRRKKTEEQCSTSSVMWIQEFTKGEIERCLERQGKNIIGLLTIKKGGKQGRGITVVEQRDGSILKRETMRIRFQDGRTTARFCRGKRKLPWESQEDQNRARLGRRVSRPAPEFGKTTCFGPGKTTVGNRSELRLYDGGDDRTKKERLLP